MTAGERLEEARRFRGWSKNELYKELAGIRGASYGSVRNYLAGRSEPPLEVLIGAARALAVSEAYLTEGAGSLTDAHADASEATTAATPIDVRDSIAPRLKQAGQEGIGLPGSGGSHVPSWVAPLTEIWTELAGRPSPHDYRDPAEVIAAALRGPIDAFAVDVERIDAGRYVLAMLPALLLLADAHARQAQQHSADERDVREHLPKHEVERELEAMEEEHKKRLATQRERARTWHTHH